MGIEGDEIFIVELNESEHSLSEVDILQRYLNGDPLSDKERETYDQILKKNNSNNRGDDSDEWGNEDDSEEFVRE